MAERVLEILLGVKRRKLRQDLRKARRDVGTFAKTTSSKIRSSFKDAFGTIAGLGTIGGLAVVGKDVLEVDKKLTRLGIQAGVSKDQMNAFGSRLRDLSDDSGLSTASLTDAAAKFVSLTGSFDSAKAGAEIFAKTAAASGSSIEDVATAAASLNKNLGVKGPEGFAKGLSILLTQGKAGAVELRELAGLLPSLAPSFTKFGKAGNEGLAELGAALQVVKDGFGSGSEAATGLGALMTALSKNAGKFEKAGVKIFDRDPKTGAKRFRQFSKIIESIGKSKLILDPTKLSKAFGSSEAERAFQELDKSNALFQELFAKGLASNAVDEDFAVYMESSSGRIEKAWQRLQNVLARQLTPERIDALVKAFESLGRGVAYVVDHFQLFVAAFAAIKIVHWTSRLYGLIGAMRGVGSATGKASRAAGELGTSGAASVGKFGKALAGVSAFALGYQLGVALDNALGLSDAIAGVQGLTGVNASRFDPKGTADKYRQYANENRSRAHELETRLERSVGEGDQRYVMESGALKKLPKNAKQTIARERREAARFERKARVVEILERVRQLDGVDVSALPAQGKAPEQVVRAVAEQTVRHTGGRGTDPEVQALIRAVLTELQRQRRVEVRIEGHAVDATLAYSNQVGRAPAP